MFFDTFASDPAVGGSDETAWQEFTIDAAVLADGTNVVAVEVHQVNATSSDVNFDLELIGNVPKPTVVLDTPVDGTVVNQTAVSFTCTVADPSGVKNVELRVENPSETVTLSGTADIDDATLSEDTPDAALGSASDLLIDSLAPSAHSVMKFPTLIGTGDNQIPSGATIESATCEVYCTNPGDTVTMSRLLKDWTESEVTWNERMTAQPWAPDGGADNDDDNDGSSIPVAFPATG